MQSDSERSFLTRADTDGMSDPTPHAIIEALIALEQSPKNHTETPDYEEDPVGVVVVGSKRTAPQSKDDDDDEERVTPWKMLCARIRAPKASRILVAKYYPGKPVPRTPGYMNIVIHTSGSNLGGDLSPYILSDEHGQLLENVWQFSKVYASVTAQRVPISQKRQDIVIWEHPKEVHFRNGQVTAAYWRWRCKGMTNQYAVRYPNGYDRRQACLFSLWPDAKGDFQALKYIEARKQIYCGEYKRLAPKTPHFKKLQSLLSSGVNLQILEVDGPDPTLRFPPYDRISKESPGLPMCEETIRMLLHDDRKPFGHGYVIAALLLGGADWLS